MQSKAKNKTEAFLKFRGKDARNATARVFGSDGKSSATVTISPGIALRLVTQYKYLGSLFSSDGAPCADVALRVSSSSGAYNSIARKVFGQQLFPVHVRCCLATSLIFSRLLYGVSTWSKITFCTYKRLNSVYMRVYRQIAGCPRFRKSTLDDLSVRKLLGKPSLQCIIARHRLSLLSSLLRVGNPTTLAMLSVKAPAGTFMPWMRPLLLDLAALYADHGEKL